ncbi:class I adenylate-forming enzyme family protein, partial [Pontitalea aquivivens]|uniref:class I adenylate-forming enzyme family protein n=1 Tax=Pontitalea aquivivens TaxID=3388663 RepID=UPI00397115A7
GSSAMPKPVLRSHRAETWSVESYIKGWAFETGDRVFVPLSLAWAWGLTVQSMTTIGSGATLYLDKSFNPVRALEAFEKYRITTFAGTGSMYAMLMDVLKERNFDISSLKKLFIGGEPSNANTVETVQAHFKLKLFEGYAMSESFPHLVLHPRDDVNAPKGAVGRRVGDDAEIRLIDSDGNDVPHGEVGHAILRSPGRMTEYYREPEMTSDRFMEGGWVKTGDLLREDENGYFFFEGRISDLIIRGGANISPVEIEDAASRHPLVKDIVVVGIPDEARGEKVVATVVAKSDELSEAALFDFFEQNLAKYKVPQIILFTKDLPVGATGKINRKAVRAMVLEKTDASQG